MRKVLYIVLPVVVLIFAFPYLLSLPPFKQILVNKIQNKINAKVKIDQLGFTWLGPQTFKGVHIANTDLNGSIEEIVLKTKFWKIGDQPYSLSVRNGQFNVLQGNTSLGSIQQIQANVEGSKVNATGVTAANGKSGSFSIQGTAIAADQFDLTFFADQMPTEPIDCLLGLNGDLIGMIGSSFNITGSAANSSNSGSLNAELTAITAKASIQTQFTPESITLDAPLSLSTLVPPSVVKQLAKKGLLVKDPISLYISNNSFIFPRPFNLKKLAIGAATLALQRVAVPRPDSMGNLALFLKTPQLGNTQNIDICLTPADFSLNNGVLTLGRVDALAEQSIHLCCWGKVNLITENINAILGVPSDTLSQTLLAISPPSDFCLQIPISGTYENPKFDTGTASVQLAGLVAAGQAQKAGGNFGVFGDIVGQAISQVSQPDTTPPQKYSIPCQ